MRSRRWLLLVLAVVVAVVVGVVVARGGDDGGPTLTHAQLVERANAICARLARQNARLEAAPKPYDDQSEPFFTAIGDNTRAAYDALAALEPPSEVADAFGRLLDGYDRANADFLELESAASVEQAQEIEIQLAEIVAASVDIAAAEREIGICPGKTSARHALGVQVMRTRPNPLTESGGLTD
jgi:hypothetical protein